MNGENAGPTGHSEEKTEQFSVYLKVRPGREAAFIEASRVNQAGARQEPGNLKFDIYRSADDPSHFLFIEEYDSEASVSLHRETPHFLSWLDTVTPMLVEPRQRVPGNDVPAEFRKMASGSP